MKRFTRLCRELEEASQPREKVAALASYFREVAPADAAWALQFLCGRKPPRAVTSSELRAWAAEEIDLPEWLFDECQETVGDLAETIALLLPESDSGSALPLHELIEGRLLPLRSVSASIRRDLVRQTWRELDAGERLVWNKLITGGFRVGAVEKLVVHALAERAGVEVPIMAHRLAGRWQPTAESYLKIIHGNVDSRPEAARTHPFFLASPMEGEPAALGNLAEWQVEWKWSGLRAQLIRRHGEVLLWSHGDELITASFPEAAEAGCALPDGTVLDGQIVTWLDGRAQPVEKLKRRLGRKSVGTKLRVEIPVMFLAYDLLEHCGEDWRARSLVERRRQLEAVIAGALGGNSTAGSSVATALDETPDLFGFEKTPIVAPALRISEVILRRSWDELTALLKESRARYVGGLILKRRSSVYGVGCQQGDWWEWNVDSLVMNAVLIGAQSGQGRQTGGDSEYTFAVWHEGKLTTVAKVNSGLSDAEVIEVDAFVRANTTGKFGPMRAVKPDLVFELAFEGVQPSSRHKSGLTVQRPRINQWRREKKAEEADSLETLRAMLREGTPP